MNLLELHGVSKSYSLGSSTVPAVRNVSLNIASGEFTALMGPSGSGKSTILNICGLIDRPTDGSVSFLERSLSAASDTDTTALRREHVGFVFQGFNLIPVMNVRDNVEYPLWLSGRGAKERVRRVDEVLARVGLTGFEQRKPDELSGGQRQRVAIARAVVKRPSLIVADEPTANLDSRTTEQVIDLLAELNREDKMTFIIATHDERVARRCTRTIRMVDGQLGVSQ